jgi:hypothetical protein
MTDPANGRAVRVLDFKEQMVRTLVPTGENYFIPSRGDGDQQTYEGQGGGEFPNTYWDNGYSVTNGEWVLEPDFTRNDWTQCTLSAWNVGPAGAHGIHPAAPGQDACVTFNIAPYNASDHWAEAEILYKGQRQRIRVDGQKADVRRVD